MTTTDEQFDRALRDVGEMRRFVNRHGLDGQLIHADHFTIPCGPDVVAWSRVVGLLADPEVRSSPYLYVEGDGCRRDIVTATQEFGSCRLSVTKLVPSAEPLPFDAPGRVVADGVGL